jgi:glycosyltransferase involved in cell wall biosynthesis
MNSISVVVPTYNGAHKVQNALRALSQQSLLPNEIIVVIDGSTDQTGEKIHWEFIKSGQFQALAQVLCIIEQPNGGRAASRNRGAKE